MSNITYGIDTQKPSLEVSVVPAEWTNIDPIVTFNAIDATSGIDHYGLSVDGNPSFIESSPVNLSGMHDGRHDVTIRALDYAGNIAEQKITVLVDKSPPEQFVPFAKPAGWTQLDPIITFNTEDDFSGTDHFEIQIDNGSFNMTESPAVLQGITGGEHIVTIRAYDAAGNHRDGNVTIYIDRTPPEGLAINMDGGHNSTTSRQVKLLLKAFDNLSGLDSMSFSNDGTWFTAWEPFASGRNWTLSGGDGDKTVYVKVRDHAGNEARAASAVIAYHPKPTQNTQNILSLRASAFVIMVIVGLFIWYRRRTKRRLKESLATSQ
jgi:hypothetical protein